MRVIRSANNSNYPRVHRLPDAKPSYRVSKIRTNLKYSIKFQNPPRLHQRTSIYKEIPPHKRNASRTRSLWSALSKEWMRLRGINESAVFVSSFIFPSEPQDVEIKGPNFISSYILNFTEPWGNKRDCCGVCPKNERSKLAPFPTSAYSVHAFLIFIFSAAAWKHACGLCCCSVVRNSFQQSSRALKDKSLQGMSWTTFFWNAIRKRCWIIEAISKTREFQ